MVAIIDWLSFTIPYTAGADTFASKNTQRERFQKAVNAMLKQTATLHTYDDTYTEVKPNRPYHYAFQSVSFGFVVHYSNNRSEALVTLSGQVCDHMRTQGLLNELLPLVAERGTRIDIALDVETGVTPKAIHDAGFSKRIASHSLLESGDGQTAYIGSRTSERFLRVYKYSPPHPRSHLLRFEWEIKGKAARSAAQAIEKYGTQQVINGLRLDFGLKYKGMMNWFVGKSVSIDTETHNRSMAKTERWLLTQAVPAFHKLVKAGVIDDPQQWVNKWMLGGVKDGS